MSELGDLDLEDFRASAHRAVDWVADYLASAESRPVLSRTTPGATRAALPAAPPAHAEPFDAVLADIDSILMPAMTHWNAPGFLAYFASSASSPGIVGELLAAGLNVNAMLWRTSPAATELEQVATDWLRQLLGLPQPMFGVINDTASSSTLYALAAARHALQLDIDTQGMSGRSLPALRCYASAEAHSSVEKALMVLGLGREGLHRIPVDDQLRMRVDALEEAVAADRAAGVTPMAVIATVGTTSTTSIDPVADIARVCERERLWLHVDAAYGGAAAVAPELRWVLAGVEGADSLVVNPHKWLFTPIDCSVLWTRRPDALRGAFSLIPEYLRSSEQTDPDAPNLMDYGTSLGRRFRALKLWMVMRGFGSEGLATRIRAHCAMAATLAARVRDSQDFELMAPAPLSVVCLRARSDGADSAALDSLNQQLLDHVNAAGEFFLSHTRVRDAHVIRVAFGNLRTTAAHADRLWDVLVATRGALVSAPPRGV